MPRLSVRSVAGGGDGRVLKGIDFEIEAGELIVVLGPSGAGKTTLLECIAGLQKPSQGIIEIGGTVVFGPGVDLPPRERGIGIAYQDLGLWPHVNVLDHVSLCLEKKRSTSSRNIDSMMVLERLNLRGKMLSLPGQLSGGERRRLALARALACSPKVLLLDEPMAGADAALRDVLIGVIREVHERAKSATIMVTHRLDEALALADRIAILSQGSLHQMGGKEDVYNHPLTRSAARLMGFENTVPAEVMGEYVNQLVPLERQRELGARDQWAVAIRARDIHLPMQDEDGHGQLWTGTVIDSRFAGGCYQTVLNVGNFEITVLSSRYFESQKQLKLAVDDRFQIVENW